ncbi:MAG TPA: hypothetical protein VFH87_01800 [Candidatus Udaeobacter sp.]|nr:hypothetical protein [Candidatus Udaeobacter sp.]
MTLPPTELERTAIAIHDFIWKELGPGFFELEVSGNDEACDRIVGLLNRLQAEIVARELQSFDYSMKRDDK